MIVQRLSENLRNVKTTTISEAGHMLAITHASQINPLIARHIRSPSLSMTEAAM